MSLNDNVMKKIHELEKEVVTQLSRAASVADTEVGLVSLIEDALSTAKTLTTLRELVAVSDTPQTELPSAGDTYIESNGSAPRVSGVRIEPRRSSTIFDQLTQVTGIKPPTSVSGQIDLHSLKFK